jgi:capsular polysaccharide transport system permease protein
LSEDRISRRDADNESSVAAGSTAPAGGSNEPDQRRRERGGDNPLSRRDRNTPARARLDRRIEQRLTVVPGRAPSTEVRPDVDRGPRLALPGPAPRRARPYGTLISFVVMVVVPLIVASLYYGFIASNQYVAEFRFAVKDTTPTSSASVGTSLMTLLGGGSGSAPLENYIVADYLTSRQAAEELQRRIHVESLYSKPSIDWWARFDSSEPMEKFVTYWQKMVTSNYDIVTGIATAQIRAFSPQDTYLIANTLVKMSEELVNTVANRSNLDSVHFAENEVEKAQDRLKKARAQMTAYRNKVGVIDPTTSVVAPNSTVQTTLQANLATLETQLTSLLNRHLSLASPAVQSLQNQIKAVKEQLTTVEASVAAGKDRAGGASLSSVIAEYEQLELERQFSQALVTSAMQALEQARALASAQHLYITPYVRPSLPQSSIYPNRLMSILTVALIAFAIWLVGLLTLRSILERFG